MTQTVTDEDKYQQALPIYNIAIEIAKFFGRVNEVNRLETILLHCQWRRDNQYYPHPKKEERV